ncbi:MAG: hypothetical protein J6Z14_02595 [Prevotella sp.]|nr:hypothetical protein [Prevotella sp.]
MKNFDTKRFGHVLKLDFAEGLKPMLWGALAITLLYLFFFWFAHNIAYDSSWYNSHPEKFSLRVCEAVGGFSTIAMLFYFLIAASILYRNEQKKQQRIAWLMLPATNLEKFLSRWLYLVAFSLVGGLLTFFVTDAIHMVWLWLGGKPVMAATPFFFHTLPHPDKYNHLLRIIVVYGMMVTIHAFFLMGSLLFKKYHFIVSSALFVLFFTVMASLYNTSGLYMFNSELSNRIFDIVMIVLETGAIILFTWLAYRLFCRWQVVTHKFVNV